LTGYSGAAVACLHAVVFGCVVMGDIGPEVPVSSAGREHERRCAKREDLTRKRHPRIGSALLALRNSPQDERNRRTGGEGAVIVTRILAKRCGDRVVLLHDRRIPWRRTTIDHIAVARSGVWVIDAKRYRAKVEVAQARLAVAGSDKTRLVVAGRDRTRLVDGLSMQVELVAAAVAEVDPTIAVDGVMCFVAPRGRLTSNSIPVLRTLRIRGYTLMRPGSLARRLNRKGDLSQEQMTSIASVLARRFPMA